MRIINQGYNFDIAHPQPLSETDWIETKCDAEVGYRKSLGREAAKLELLRNSGICYEPDLVKIFDEKTI